MTKLWYNTICWGPLDDADIFEADVEFDVTEPWYASNFDPAATGVHLRTVAVHEFGHALGLMHEDDVLDTMNSFYPGGGSVTQNKLTIPLADARQGARFLYDEGGPALPDLVACNFKRTGSGVSGLVNGPTSAMRGTAVTIEYTLMNIGSMGTGSFTVGFYLSSNNSITTSDTLLGTALISPVAAGAVATRSQTLTIPLSTPPGTYFLGVLLDKDNIVPEWNEGAANNGLAQPRAITVTRPIPIPF